ncbi:MAG: helix-turn-helix domain-containing protein [Clostridia bacterium]|nr:helix-turn-helix domain-containing protein [Clostridia bacterium]
MPKERIAAPTLVRSDGEFRETNLEIRHKHFNGESHLHWHDYYEFEYIKSGSITYQYNGNSYTLSAGSAYLVTPSDYHNIIAYEAELYNIAFNDAQISRDFLEKIISYNGETIVRLNRQEQRSIEQLLVLLLQEYERDDEFSEYAMHHLLETVLVYFVRALPDQKACKKNHSSAVMQAVSHIHLHFKEKLTLREVAAAIHLTPNYLGEIFKAEMGISFSAYLMQTRLVSARSLLQNGRCTVTQAGLASGFTSPAYFSECFKKEYGYPPYQEAAIAAASPSTADPTKEL